MKNFSFLAQNLKPSMTVAIDRLAKQKILNGEQIINLGAGEPDLSPPSGAFDAVQKHLHSNTFKYGNVSGIPELRNSIANKIQSQLGLKYSGEEILITSDCAIPLLGYLSRPDKSNRSNPKNCRNAFGKWVSLDS